MNSQGCAAIPPADKLLELILQVFLQSGLGYFGQEQRVAVTAAVHCHHEYDLAAQMVGEGLDLLNDLVEAGLVGSGLMLIPPLLQDVGSLHALLEQAIRFV